MTNPDTETTDPDDAEAQALLEFLTDRLNEDEVAARAAILGPELPNDHADRAHIARHSPDRVLAEIEAKRKVLTIYRATRAAHLQIEDLGEFTVAGTDDEMSLLFALSTTAGAVAVLERILKLMSVSWADHPAYRQEWTTVSENSLASIVQADAGDTAEQEASGPL